jgi:hypothetical protein
LIEICLNRSRRPARLRSGNASAGQSQNRSFCHLDYDLAAGQKLWRACGERNQRQEFANDATFVIVVGLVILGIGFVGRVSMMVFMRSAATMRIMLPVVAGTCGTAMNMRRMIVPRRRK